MNRKNPNLKLRKKVLQNFYYYCAICNNIKNNKLKPLFLHHIDGKPYRTIEKNLVPLCISCHNKVHIEQSFRKIIFKKPSIFKVILSLLGIDLKA